MKIENEEQILDQDFRVKVIKEIAGNENVTRKLEAKRTFDLLKDRTKQWVIESLREENLEEETIATMANRASNISIFRTVVEKLARTYSGGIQRSADTEGHTLQINAYEDLLNVDQCVKKADRWLEAFKNALIQVVPVKNHRESSAQQVKRDLKIRVFAPYQYDVLNYMDNPEKGAVHILSDFQVDGNSKLDLKRYRGKTSDKVRGVDYPNVVGKSSDGVDQSIADPDDERSTEYIWWSDKYHFTTNGKGEIIAEKSPEENLNPIGISSFVELMEDQDGEYWAEGGKDLRDSAILINKLITDMNSIAYQQGWGQPVITGGENLPKNFKIGTQNALVFTYDKETEPEPRIQVIQGNPPIDQWGNMIKQYAALTLSTNGLTPGNISMDLDPNKYQSGIAMMIEQSVANNDIQNKQAYFVDVERELWRVITLWHNILLEKGALSSQFANVGKLPESDTLTWKFHELKPPVSEKEQLEVMQLRRDLGLDTVLDMIKRDNPDMDEQQAQEKLAEVMKEKLERVQMIARPAQPQEDDDNGEEEQGLV